MNTKELVWIGITMLIALFVWQIISPLVASIKL